MCDFMEPCHDPMLRVPLKKNIGRVLRQVPTFKELSSYPLPPALGEKWIVTEESTLLDNIIGLYFFPTTLPKSTGWVPSFLAGQNTNYSRKKKKKQQQQQPTLENNFQSGECSQQPPTNLLSRQRMWVWWFQGHFFPPQYFSSLNFNRWEMPEWRTGVHGAPGRALGRRARYAPDGVGAHCLAPSILSQKTNEFGGCIKKKKIVSND